MHQGRPFDARLAHIMPQVASTGAAVAVADFDRDGWQDFYVTNSGEGSLNLLYRNKRRRHVRGRAGAVGLADVNQRGTGVSMGAVWGDLRQRRLRGPVSSTSTAAGAVSQRQGPRFDAVAERAGLPAGSTRTARPGSTTTATAGSTLFIAGYWPEHVDLWQLETTEDHAGELRVREQRRPQVSAATTAATARSRTDRALGITSRRWTLALAAAISSAPATRLCSSPTTTACRSCSPIAAASVRRRRAAGAASAGRRRAG
jgi:hypothetical protein